MAGTGYEIFALLMRYVFVALGALILLRALFWLRKDARAWHKEIKNLPDAGLVGELRDMQSDQSYPLPREGVLGKKHSCDIRIKGHLMPGKALTFLFVEGKGLAITPLGGQNVYLDGEAVRGSKGYALHGTQLEVGGTVLKVRLFAGLKVPRRVLYSPAGEDENDPVFDGPSPFEEVAGMMSAPAQPQWQEVAMQFQEEPFNPFMDEVSARQHGDMPLWDGENAYAIPRQDAAPWGDPHMQMNPGPNMPQPMPFGSAYPPANAVPKDPFMADVPDYGQEQKQQSGMPDEMQNAGEMPVRRRRSDRYL